MSKTRRVQWLERALHLLDDLAGCAERGQFTRTEALSLIELCKSSPLTSTGEISEMWDVWMKLFGADEIPEQTELASSLRRAEEQVRALQTVTAVRDVAYTEVSSEPPLDAEVQDETDLGPSVQELRRHRSREGLERARAEHVEIKRGWFAQKKGSGAPNPIDLLRREMCMNRKR